jgi:hypothetical protein
MTVRAVLGVILVVAGVVVALLVDVVIAVAIRTD